MRGRMKTAGIVAVALVVALGIGLTFHLMDTPASADANGAATNTVENQAANTNRYAETQAWVDSVIEKCAVDTVEIDGYTYGVLENGKTFGMGTYPNTDYEPDYQPALASDGGHAWVCLDEVIYVDDVHSPAEWCYLRDHPRTEQYALYVEPGGEVYEYVSVDLGDPAYKRSFDNSKSVVIRCVDGSQIVMSRNEFKANPSVLEQYDVLFVVGSEYTPEEIEEQGLWIGPYRERNYDSPNGTHLLVKLRDNSVVDITLDEYYANPDILDQYDIRDIIHTEKSLEEYEAMGVADELFW